MPVGKGGPWRGWEPRKVSSTAVALTVLAPPQTAAAALLTSPAWRRPETLATVRSLSLEPRARPPPSSQAVAQRLPQLPSSASARRRESCAERVAPSESPPGQKRKASLARRTF